MQSEPEQAGRYVAISDTRLYIVERGQGYPLILLHGGPGLDHHEFADYLDPLGDQFRLIFVDQRSQGRSDPTPPETWTLEQMARDVTALARALGLERYAVLGHSYGAFVALKHAVLYPQGAAQTIVSSGLPSARFLTEVEQNLATFEPVALREQVASSWAREQTAETQDDMDQLMRDQMPFHFADPLDPRIADFNRRAGRAAGAVYAPAVLRLMAQTNYGGIEVEDQLAQVAHPVLVLAGRHDRTCPVAGAEAIAHGIPGSELVIFEHSGHMTYVEEQERYLAVARDFLTRHP